MPDGTTAYTRDGTFKTSSDGTVVNSSGYPLSPQINIPTGSQQLTITPAGKVSVVMPGQSTLTEIGQIEIARFVNPEGLVGLSGNLYGVSDASGEPSLQTPGQNGIGTLLQGYTEASNVQVVDEMVNMISAQRAYEIVAKAITVSDQMMQTTNSMKS
jgi:flagellar basal-body rod protein FlgG